LGACPVDSRGGSPTAIGVDGATLRVVRGTISSPIVDLGTRRSTYSWMQSKKIYVVVLSPNLTRNNRGNESVVRTIIVNGGYRQLVDLTSKC
jgi:hypothetical protein